MAGVRGREGGGEGGGEGRGGEGRGGIVMRRNGKKKMTQEVEWHCDCELY